MWVTMIRDLDSPVGSGIPLFLLLMLRCGWIWALSFFSALVFHLLLGPSSSSSFSMLVLRLRQLGLGPEATVAHTEDTIAM